MFDFNSSLESQERYNSYSNGYRTHFHSMVNRTGEQNEMSKARRLFRNRKRRKTTQRFTKYFIKINIASLLVVIFTSGFHQIKGKIADTIYMSI